MWTLELIVIAVLILVNGVFAGFEIALATVDKNRLQSLRASGLRGSAAALRMKQSMESSLAVVQLGITLVGASAAATGGAGAEELIEPLLLDGGVSATVAQFLAIALVVAPLTVFTIIFGELVPKVFSLRNQEWVCLRLSPIMELFAYSVWPAVWFLETCVHGITRWAAPGSQPDEQSGTHDSATQELHRAAAMARASRVIGHREQGIIMSASRLASTPVQNIVLPSEFISMLVADQSLDDALLSAYKDMHTRFPVTEEPGDPQKIIGYVNFKDIVVALRNSPRPHSVRSLVRTVHIFDPDTSVADCLEHLMLKHHHIALVRDATSAIIGLVTMEDIVEELLGEIHDEFDRMPAYLAPAGAGWIAGGFVTLNRLRDVAGIHLEPASERPVLMLNDWIIERLGRPARGGDEIEIDAWKILVRKTRRSLVQEVHLSRLATDSKPASNQVSGE